jgi:hypothetical protein
MPGGYYYPGTDEVGWTPRPRLRDAMFLSSVARYFYQIPTIMKLFNFLGQISL